MTKKLNKMFRETPIWHDDSKELSKDDAIHAGIDNARTNAKYYGKKPLFAKKNGDFAIEVWEYVLPASPKKKNVLVFCLMKNNYIAGYIRGEIVTSNQGITSRLPTVEISVVKDEFQGKGLGKSMYEALMSAYGGIISDKTLTGETGAGSFNIWERLGNKYHSYILYKGQLTPVQGFHREDMEDNDDNADKRFVVSKDEIK